MMKHRFDIWEFENKAKRTREGYKELEEKCEMFFQKKRLIWCSQIPSLSSGLVILWFQKIVKFEIILYISKNIRECFCEYSKSFINIGFLDIREPILMPLMSPTPSTLTSMILLEMILIF